MNEFITITLVIMLAAISPGPDFVMLTRNALCFSRMNGIYTAMGIACGTFFHSVYCILGLTIIISKSLLLFNIIKYIGASYIIYIGICSLLSKRTATVYNSQQSGVFISKLTSFRQGFLCNALNPKCIFFFLALFTMVMKPGTPVHIQALYAIEIALIHFTWFATLAIFITHPQIKSKVNKVQHYVSKVMGVFLVSLGLRIALTVHEEMG